MSRRLAVALAALACVAFPSSSAADVGPDGWGISDDFYVPSISLDDTFDELEPKSFRLIAAWNRLHEPSYQGEIRSKIAEANAAARTPGGMEIAISFSVPPQTWQGVPLTGQAWLDQVVPFISMFTADVEWWSPVNEPGLRGWTFTPSGASMVADFSIRLRDHLQQSHPADKLLSPDFNDHYNADGTLKRHPDGTSFVERYVKLFNAAGGQFGSAVSWHAHAGVMHMSALSTDDLITTLAATSGAGLPIWITEAGSHVDDTRAPGQTEAQQAAQVQWLTDTNTGLASRDQVTRMNYYNMRDEVDPASPTCIARAGFPWDTALVRACGEKRPAWYVWCLAARRRDAACYDDSPGVASWGSTRLDVFWRGNGDDAATYTRSWDGAARPSGPWSSITSHGGATNSSPAAIAPASRRLELYVRGVNNAVYHRRYDGTSWSAWTSLGGLTYASPAASARRGTSIVDVFVRGTDNTIRHRSRNGSTWSSTWASIGAPPGGATSAPATVSNATGRTELFVRGGDGAVWRRTRTTSWGPWTSLGGATSSAPAVTSRGTNRLDLFARGADGQVIHRSTDGGAWSAWKTLGGATLSAPAAVAPSSNRIDLWARDTNNALQHRVWQPSTGWSAWSSSWHPGPRP